jgi:hypothetical protein
MFQLDEAALARFCKSMNLALHPQKKTAGH